MQTGGTIGQVGVMLLQPVQWAPLENKLLLVSGRGLDWGISCGLFAWHSLRCWHLTFHVGKRMCPGAWCLQNCLCFGHVVGHMLGEEWRGAGKETKRKWLVSRTEEHVWITKNILIYWKNGSICILFYSVYIGIFISYPLAPPESYMNDSQEKQGMHGNSAISAWKRDQFQVQWQQAHKTERPEGRFLFFTAAQKSWNLQSSIPGWSYDITPHLTPFTVGTVQRLDPVSTQHKDLHTVL